MAIFVLVEADVETNFSKQLGGEIGELRHTDGEK